MYDEELIEVISTFKVYPQNSFSDDHCLVQMGFCSSRLSSLLNSNTPKYSNTNFNHQSLKNTRTNIPYDKGRIKYIWDADSCQKLLEMARSENVNSELFDIENSSDAVECFSKLSKCITSLMKGSMT
jgi:hypothetical protein